MVRLTICVTVLLVLVDVALPAPKNPDNLWDSDNHSSSGKIVKIHSKKKKSEKSTSSSSGDSASDDTSGASLAVSDSSLSDSDDENKESWPKSSVERHGWRKWHRKCPKCPEDARKKWKDPTIRWICGAYQRARRSFKSKCMMEYRNCQDGTMFTKIHNHRCRNQTGAEDYTHGEHFFYEYKVKLSDESDDSDSKISTDSSSEYDTSSNYDLD